MPLSSKDSYYMRMARLVADASKCRRAKYGTVIVSKDGRVVSTGFNGKPRGAANDDVCYRTSYEDNAAKPNCCLHSEANALFFCSPKEREGATAYVSGIPCTDCALLLMQARIGRLVYYDGSAVGGHRGNFDFAFYEKYGMSFEVDVFEWRNFE